ncbi:hypothetical protein HS088_TW01G00913 [Tripterygium wilfordii]|uniref:Uncharacterized protein n=1 Tax=Tripterygium wilfordii TaxID=458696 RepID=A0A7J7E313_TRIWF|nr:hypothetical protein HS088_TW01G00913 [Tripterygium wilfordii]
MSLSATTRAFLHKPIFKFLGFHGSKIRPLKPISFLHSPSSNLTLSTGFVSKNAVPKSMAELVKTSAFGSNSGDDCDRALDQEDLINGSSVFAAHGLESTVHGLLWNGKG